MKVERLLQVLKEKTDIEDNIGRMKSERKDVEAEGRADYRGGVDNEEVEEETNRARQWDRDDATPTS